MNFNLLQNVLETNTKNLSSEFKRIFHGRGNYYKNFEFLTIDSIDTIISIAFYKEIDINYENEIINIIKELIRTTNHKTIILQKRYINKSQSEIIYGKLEEKIFTIENGIKFNIDLLSHQNNGYFPDMKNGRKFIQNIAKDKNVLNLFSYTCGFSLSATKGACKNIFNVDMSKGALSKGRANHHLNNIGTNNVQFGPYNILKSFSRIKKYSPYDIIIIDPPTFQKGSFEVTKDYIKIIRRIESLASSRCTLLLCLNSPFLKEDFLIDMLKENTNSFIFEKRLKNVEEFICEDEDKSLKNLVFQNF